MEEVHLKTSSNQGQTDFIFTHALLHTEMSQEVRFYSEYTINIGQDLLDIQYIGLGTGRNDAWNGVQHLCLLL